VPPETSNFYCHPGKAGGTPLRFRANVIFGNFRLDPPDQLLAIIMGETEVGFRRQLGPLDVADCR
jgi:hypothetical protein